MVQASELIVAIRGEGIGETQEQLEGIEDSMEQTADSAANSADELEEFSERFSGAMSAAVAAVAVAAGGLLSTVPVVGELFAGLGAVIEAFGLRLDGVLRPALSGVTEELFNFSAFVLEAEGAVGLFFDALSSLVALVGTGSALLLGIAKVGALFGVWASTGAGVVSILGTIAGAIATVIGAIASLPVILIAAIAAIIAFAAAYAFNIGGVRDITNDVLSDVWQFFLDLGSNIVDWATTFASDAREWGANLIEGFLGGLGSVVDQVIQGFIGLSEGLVSWADSLASDAYNWGANLIAEFIAGLRDKLNEAGEFLGEVSATLGVDIPSASTVGTVTGGAVGGTAGAALGSAAGGLFAQPSTSRTRRGLTLDGRQLTESTGRYEVDPARRRGL